ncbi:MAG: hypothetical protein AAGC74_09640 [Verrucomicrobiota bacterium]
MRPFIITLLSILALPADQLAIWHFNQNSPLSNISSGTNFPADKEYLLGSPSLQIVNQSIAPTGKAGNDYTDNLGVTQDSPNNRDAIAWNDIEGTGSNGELLLSLNTSDYRNLILSFDYKYENNLDGNSDLMELLYSSNNGSTFTKFGSSFALLDDNQWYRLSFDFSTIPLLDNNPLVVFKIQTDATAPTSQQANNDLRFDNFEIIGEHYRSNPLAPQ